MDSYHKQKGSGTSDQSLFRLWKKFTKNSLLVILSDQVWWCNVKQFLSYSKNYTFKFMQVNSWHHYFTTICPFDSGKCGKEEEKLQKLEYLTQERKELFRWNKNIFHSFWRAIICWKNKNLIKSSRHKL